MAPKKSSLFEFLMMADPLPRVALGLAFAAAVAASSPFAASGQDARAGLTGATRPDDVITARQLLMDAVESEMTPIDLAAGGRQMPIAELKARAYMINTLLIAFPHLFPPETRPVVAPDGGPGATAATDAVWDEFEDFYAEAQAAAEVAFEASQAGDLARFLEPAQRLRQACDGCHARFMRPVGAAPPP